MARILVVDDEPGIRVICGSLLSALGHEIIEAADADEALAAYRDGHPDAVLMDVGLPGPRDGLAVAEEIARCDPGARIAMVTGTRVTAVVGRASQLGARDYVVKPFTLDDLRGAIERLLA